MIEEAEIDMCNSCDTIGAAEAFVGSRRIDARHRWGTKNDVEPIEEDGNRVSLVVGRCDIQVAVTIEIQRPPKRASHRPGMRRRV